jgi:hypothetical protein
VLSGIVHQPRNVCPCLVGVGNVLNCVPDVFSELVGDTAPPLASHVIVTVAANASLATDKHKIIVIKIIVNLAESRVSFFIIIISIPFHKFSRLNEVVQ